MTVLMETVAESGKGNWSPVCKQAPDPAWVWGIMRLTWDGTAEPNSRDQTLRRQRGQGKSRFPCSADHEQDWQPYSVDAQSAERDDHTDTAPKPNETPRKVTDSAAAAIVVLEHLYGKQGFRLTVYARF